LRFTIRCNAMSRTAESAASRHSRDGPASGEQVPPRSSFPLPRSMG
jgi:hypothetical protein